MKDQRTNHVDAEEVRRIAEAGGALTLKQLAVVINYGYDVTRWLAKQEGFPILKGKVTLEDYRDWRRRRLKLEPPAASPQS